MRTATSAQQEALYALDRTTHKSVWIEDADDQLRNVCDLYGHDFLDSVTVEADVDNPISAATILLRRKIDSYSMSPLVESSPLNLNAAGTYAPLINPGRRVAVYVSTVLANQPAGEWVLLWEGYIDEVDWGTGPNTIRLFCRDPMGRLNDTFIETEVERGNDDGSEDITEVVQEILDAYITAPGMTLVTEGTPAFAIEAYDLGNVTVWEALAELRDFIGWNIHWRHVEGTGFRLVLWEPDRSNVVPVYRFTPDDYYTIPRVGLALEGIRNKGEVVYTTAAGVVQEATETRATSVTLYGTRFIRIDARGTSVVTATQAADLLDSILDDLEEPAAQQEIECAFFWPCELGDLYAFAPNDHYDTEQKWAVFGYRHILSGDRCRTVLSVAGKPSGGYERWHRAESTVAGYATSEVIHTSIEERTHTGTTGPVSKQSFTVPALYPTANGIRVRAVVTSTGTGGTKQVTIGYNGLAANTAVTMATGNQSLTLSVEIRALTASVFESVTLEPVQYPSRGSQAFAGCDQARAVDIYLDLASAGDTMTLQLSEIVWLGEPV